MSINPPIEWRPAKDFEGLYEVSNYGDVRSSLSGKLRKLATTWQGYKSARLYKNKDYYSQTIHRMVAKAFIPNPNNYPEVNHKLGDKADNRAWMLEWCTKSMNMKHAYDVLKLKPSRPMLGRTGELSPRSKPICQCHINGEVIAVFPSIIAAERSTGVQEQNIGKVAKLKREVAGGYKWKYL